MLRPAEARNGGHRNEFERSNKRKSFFEEEDGRYAGLVGAHRRKTTLYWALSRRMQEQRVGESEEKSRGGFGDHYST